MGGSGGGVDRIDTIVVCDDIDMGGGALGLRFGWHDCLLLKLGFSEVLKLKKIEVRYSLDVVGQIWNSRSGKYIYGYGVVARPRYVF